MIFHQITPWKNTIAFCIVFDLRNLQLDKIHNGLLHFGEHLSFIETKKYTQNELRQKRDLLFDVFDAYTSLDSLVYSIVCHRSELTEVCNILKEAIYSWKCNEKQFLNEKEAIIQEIKEYNAEPNTNVFKMIRNRIFNPNVSILGSTQRIKSLTFSQLDEIKNVWKNVIRTAPRNLLIAGPRLTDAENKIFNDLFDTKKISKSIHRHPHKTFTFRNISLPTIEAIIVDSATSSPFFIILQRIYYVRHLKLNPDFNSFFDRKKEYLAYIIYKNNKKKLNKIQSKKFLLYKPTKEEFELAKDIVTKHMDSLSDGINPYEILEWLSTFHIQNFPEFQGKTFSQIRKIYTKISYNNFLIQWNTIFKDIKN